MKKLICLCLALIIACPVFAKDLFVEGEQEACEYLGISRKELVKIGTGPAAMTCLVAIVRKMKEIERAIPREELPEVVTGCLVFGHPSDCPGMPLQPGNEND